MSYIYLGNYKIEVSISNKVRMVKHSDIKDLLGLKKVTPYFIDAKIITDILFDLIYKSKRATKEQEIIFKGLCIVGIYSLIDEAYRVNLSDVSYSSEFKNMINLNQGK